MTRGKRRRIFYGLLAAFFVLGTAVILYVSGWRLDLKTLRIKKVGAIFVQSFPRDAKIFLGNRPIENESGLLQSGTLINGLFPQTYELKLVADGFKPWLENISVLPSLVSEVKYAVLIPEQALTIATGTIKNFWLFNDRVVIQTQKNELFLAGRKIGDGEIAGWTKDFRNLLLSNPKSASWIWLDILTGEKINLGPVLSRAGLKSNQKLKIIPDPENQNILLIQEPKKISTLDTGNSQLTQFYKTPDGEIGEVIPATQSFIVWSEFLSKQNNSLLAIYDRFLKRVRSDSPTFAGRTVKLLWLANRKAAILRDNGGLYLYDMDKNESAKVADDVKNFAFSKDGDFLATLENASLEIFSLNDSRGYHRFNLPEISRAEKIIWYQDNNHLFVAYPGRIAFLDINDGGLGNFTTVTNSSSPQYDENNTRLYFLDERGVERLDFPR